MAKKQLTSSQIDGMLGRPLKRAVFVERAEPKVDDETRTIEMSFSSDAPVEHWFGKLILNHAPACVRLERLRAGGPFVLDHDRTKLVGVHERVETDGHRLRGAIRFSRSALGEETYQDIKDGIRPNTSVKAVLYEMHLVREDEGGPVYQSDDWEPIHNSSVAEPADTSVGVGRTLDDDDEAARADEAERRSDTCACDGAGCDECNPTAGEERADDSEAGAERSADQPTTEVRTAMAKPNEEQNNTTVTAEIALAREVVEMGEILGETELAREMAADGKSVAEFRTAIRAKRQQAQGATTPPPADPAAAAGRNGGGSVQLARSTSRVAKLRNFTGEGAEERAHRFGQWFLGGPLGLNSAQRWCQEHGIELTRAHTEKVNEKGGFLVPEEFGNDMIDLREQFGVFRRNAKIVPMASDSRTDPRRTSGLTAHFVDEGDEADDSDKGWDRVGLRAKKLMVLTRMSSEFSEDSAINAGDDLAGEISYAFAEKEDQSGFNGTGASTYGGIVGVRSKLKGLHGTIGNIAGLHVGAGNAYSELLLTDFQAVVALLPQYADTPMAKWFVHRTFYYNVMVRLMLAAGGVTAAEIEGGRKKQFLGYEVEFSQVMPKAEENSQVCALLGDLSKAASLGSRRDTTIALSEHSRFRTDEIEIKGTERVDINVHSVGNASATASQRQAGPVVGLITAAA